MIIHRSKSKNANDDDISAVRRNCTLLPRTTVQTTTDLVPAQKHNFCFHFVFLLVIHLYVNYVLKHSALIEPFI